MYNVDLTGSKSRSCCSAVTSIAFQYLCWSNSDPNNMFPRTYQKHYYVNQGCLNHFGRARRQKRICWHTVALKIHETWGTYATVPLKMTCVSSATGGSSPSIADIRDVFPSPVPPTMATKLPVGISRLMLDSVVFSAWRREKSKLKL